MCRFSLYGKLSLCWIDVWVNSNLQCKMIGAVKSLIQVGMIRLRNGMAYNSSVYRSILTFCIIDFCYTLRWSVYNIRVCILWSEEAFLQPRQKVWKSLRYLVSVLSFLTGRWYIREGWLKVVPHKGADAKNKMFFLFSDMLLEAKRCSPLHPTNENKFVGQHAYPLQDCSVEKVFGHTRSQGGLLSVSFNSSTHGKVLSNAHEGWYEKIKNILCNRYILWECRQKTFFRLIYGMHQLCSTIQGKKIGGPRVTDFVRTVFLVPVKLHYTNVNHQTTVLVYNFYHFFSVCISNSEMTL